jgi:putative glycosyltransferase (TIGR04372 family)
MSAYSFIKRQIFHIHQGGIEVLLKKINLLRMQVMKRILELPFYLLAFFALALIRLIKPWLLVRWCHFNATRIGHLALEPELYLCERDAGINTLKRRHHDIFYVDKLPICNKYLVKIWKRVLHVWPAWFMAPIYRLNRMIPGGADHWIGTGINTQYDRDVHNLLDRFQPHLQFTSDEEAHGEAELKSMGIPSGKAFVCLIVRDAAYLENVHPSEWGFSNIKGKRDNSRNAFRDCDIQNYVLVAEELANQGYYVIRMGAKVNKAINSTHPHVIDYAGKGMRSEFMDIYLGAKCELCLSSGTGWDSVPNIFRRPVIVTNYNPLGKASLWRDQVLLITKHLYDMQTGQELTLREIIARGLFFSQLSSEYESKGVRLIENTPEEILGVCMEMVERLKGIWQPHEDDEVLQKRFREIFVPAATDASLHKQPLHGEIRSRFGAVFLRENRAWLQ